MDFRLELAGKLEELVGVRYQGLLAHVIECSYAAGGIGGVGLAAVVEAAGVRVDGLG
jgi:hypothetical protein